MLDKFKKIFASKKDDSKPHGGDDVKVAACALLIEMALADDNLGSDELENIIAILKNNFGVEGEDADKLMKESQKALDKSIDLWGFAKKINENYSKSEKIGVIEMIWRVVYADGKLDKHEDYLVHKLSTLLRLQHKEMIDAKIKIKSEYGID